MATLSQPGQEQPAPSNSDQTRELLHFLREENASSRNAVRDDAEANRKLLLDTVKIVSFPVGVVLAIAAFLGFKSFGDFKQTVQDEARRETRSEISRMQGEIRTRLDDQFKTPTLQKMVKDAAQESTKATAEPLIKAEVETQVRSRVDAQKPAIVDAVTRQTEVAVKQIGSQIDSLVKQSVDTKVSTQVDPVINKLRNEANVQLLITRMNADDAQAFDTLNHFPLGTDPYPGTVIIPALRSAVEAHNSGMFTGRTFNSPQSDEQLAAHLSDPDPYSRQAALDALLRKKNLSLLPKIAEMMVSDSSINVRCSAYRAFNDWTTQSFQCLDSDNALRWWEANKQNFLSRH